MAVIQAGPRVIQMTARLLVVELDCPVRRHISPFNLKKGDVVGSFCNTRNAAPMFRPDAAGDKALLYEIFCCQTPMAPGPPTGMKMGGRRCLATRYAPVYVIQFSKICEPLPPTPYDENSRFRYCTSNSIHEAKN